MSTAMHVHEKPPRPTTLLGCSLYVVAKLPWLQHAGGFAFPYGLERDRDFIRGGYVCVLYGLRRTAVTCPQERTVIHSRQRW